MNTLRIDLGAISYNIALLKKHLPPHTRLMAMIKANAYGTDAVHIACYLEKEPIEMFGVAFVKEALELCEAGISKPLFVMYVQPEEVEESITHDLEISINDSSLIPLAAREAKKQNKTASLHLHINTGMNRLGVDYRQAIECAEAITSHPSLRLSGLYTHFSCADMPEQDFFNHHQMTLFRTLHETLKQKGFLIPWIHAANSAAAIRLHANEWNLARVGLALYGASPFSLPLKPALSLHSTIASLHRCQQGDTISYGRIHKIEQDALIAVLPIGYHDGIHRHFTETAYALVKGKKAPFVGRICMDFMMVDVTEIPDIKIGDTVTLFGDSALSVEEFAKRGNTISHELLACLGPRIKREFIKPLAATSPLLVESQESLK